MKTVEDIAVDITRELQLPVCDAVKQIIRKGVRAAVAMELRRALGAAESYAAAAPLNERGAGYCAYVLKKRLKDYESP